MRPPLAGRGSGLQRHRRGAGSPTKIFYLSPNAQDDVDDEDHKGLGQGWVRGGSGLGQDWVRGGSGLGEGWVRAG